MRTLLILFGALTALTSASLAADLPQRLEPPPVAAPIFTWTGVYAGVNAGYAFDVSNMSLFDRTGDFGYGYVGSPNAVFPVKPSAPGHLGGGVILRNRGGSDGFAGGGEVGYNYQFAPGNGIVVGVEADAQYADFGRRQLSVIDTGIEFGHPTGSGSRFFDPSDIRSLAFFGTVRGRIGYAFDRVLFYGTGGFAYGSTERDFRTGYAAGAGVEYALPTDSFLNVFQASAVTLKVEALYVNLGRGGEIVAANGNTKIRLSDPNLLVGQFGPDYLDDLPKDALRRDMEFAVVRAGLNYKFGTW